ncbi:MAG: ComEC/Rec2 family competence protein [Pseudorhodoplanes sp.]
MVRRRLRGLTGTWPVDGERARVLPVWSLPRFAPPIAAHLKSWIEAESIPGRLMPWLPVCFGIGIALYFAAPREPHGWAGLTLTLVCAAAAFACRARAVAFPAAVAATAIAAGFATATLKAAFVAHPVLAATAFSAELSGFVEVREERERSDRIVVRVHRIETKTRGPKPERVRVAVRKGTAPPVGAFVAMKARLNPPLPPLRPGGYDFARDIYFQKIGAIGFALGAIRTLEPPAAPDPWLRYATVLGNLRDAIDARIRAVIPGDAGAIASALLTGKRDALTPAVNDAMFVSGLGHVLSISGYHMAIVAGVVFFVIRAGFALIPGFADRHPIKKWAAFGALLAAFFYLLLSGAEVATQRSFIMTGIVLFGIMVERSALTFRTLSVAALVVLLFAPQALVHPSFQMSFAATLALIAGYRNGLPFLHGARDTPLAARAALFGAREIVALLVASLLAGLATMPYAAYHFHRLAPYGVLANLLAMPIVSIVVMPMGLLALLAIPFGFDGFLWQAMGKGVDAMVAVALWVASLPGAVGRIAAFGTGPLLLCSAGLIVICLLRSPLRWSGALLVAIACVLMARAPQPDIYVSDDGRTVAVRNAAGRLSVMKSGNDTFAIRDWLAADADVRNPKDASLAEDIRCDDAGCIGRLGDGRVIALSLRPDAIADDCESAAVIVTMRRAPRDCAALPIDRTLTGEAGAIALRRDGQGFVTIRTREPGADRPWSPASAKSAGAPATFRAAAPAAPRDATPAAEDREAGE